MLLSQCLLCWLFSFISHQTSSLNPLMYFLTQRDYIWLLFMLIVWSIMLLPVRQTLALAIAGCTCARFPHKGIYQCGLYLALEFRGTSWVCRIIVLLMDDVCFWALWFHSKKNIIPSEWVGETASLFFFFYCPRFFFVIVKRTEVKAEQALPAVCFYMFGIRGAHRESYSALVWNIISDLDLSLTPTRSHLLQIGALEPVIVIIATLCSSSHELKYSAFSKMKI